MGSGISLVSSKAGKPHWCILDLFPGPLHINFISHPNPVLSDLSSQGCCFSIEERLGTCPRSTPPPYTSTKFQDIPTEKKMGHFSTYSIQYTSVHSFILLRYFKFIEPALNSYTRLLSTISEVIDWIMACSLLQQCWILLHLTQFNC